MMTGERGYKQEVNGPDLFRNKYFADKHVYKYSVLVQHYI